MRKTIAITSVAFALAAQLAAQAPRSAGEAAEIVPMLSVSGTGEARVAPDEATVRLGVVAQAPTARAAQEQVNRTANAVLEAVRKPGIKAEDIPPRLLLASNPQRKRRDSLPCKFLPGRRAYFLPGWVE